MATSLKIKKILHLLKNYLRFPDWILAGIVVKNLKQGKPNETYSRMYGEQFAVNAKLGLEFEIKEAVRALWTLPPECADDYDAWVTAGQALHSIDETLVDEWDEWSKQSEEIQGWCLPSEVAVLLLWWWHHCWNSLSQRKTVRF